ncbi:MAG: DUF4115 domain-containing protein [Acidobacteria bacterium]|nr:DUF4115 domain-containing protein [Acidobacteriota bacterium]
MISSMDTETLQGTSGSPSTRAAASPGPVSAPEDSAELEIEFRATGPCWVSATADGQLVVYRLLQDGDRELVTAREELVLRVGDPQAFEYRINGAPGRPLGLAATPITVRITQDNYRTFAADSAGTGPRLPTT